MFFALIVLVLLHLNSIEDDFENLLTCGRRPMEKDILTDNLMWQVLEMDKG
jgi:hypothetical protein